MPFAHELKPLSAHGNRQLLLGQRCVGTSRIQNASSKYRSDTLFGIPKMLVWAVSGLTQLQNAREDQEANGMLRGNVTCKVIAFRMACKCLRRQQLPRRISFILQTVLFSVCQNTRSTFVSHGCISLLFAVHCSVFLLQPLHISHCAECFNSTVTPSASRLRGSLQRERGWEGEWSVILHFQPFPALNEMWDIPTCPDMSWQGYVPHLWLLFVTFASVADLLQNVKPSVSI